MKLSEQFRHRVNIQSPTQTQDSVTGEMSTTWSTVHADVPSAIKALSVRDFLQSQSMQSEVTVRVMFRHLQGLTRDMRLVGTCGCHLGKVYNPAGFLEDDKSGQEYITAPCSEGVNTGDA